MSFFPFHHPSIGVVATGGTITTDGTHRIHTFISNGTFTISSALSDATFDILMVGGGGGGTVYFSASYTGGGGGGGVLVGSLPATVKSYSIAIGSGGISSSGGNTTFDTFTAYGGGYATGLYQGAGAAGGNGGGGCCIGSSSPSSGGSATQTSQGVLTGYGFAGGSGWAIDGVGAGGGGGGGAGGVGGNAAYGFGNGLSGPGYTSAISGSSIVYAQGGGSDNTGATTANRGEGGYGGANGSSGIVIVRYAV